MRLETKTKLYDLTRAAELIQSAVQSVARDEFLQNWEKQSAVERQFIIIGEALVRIRDLEPAVFDMVPDARAVIGFRNLLVHGYDVADPNAIYDLVQDDLPLLLAAAKGILAASSGGAGS